MNEVTRIHLGRTAFTVSVDAHKELQAYLHAIKTHVGSKHQEVLKEVELRMAELLTEKGIGGDNKVITKEDVTYLQEQLGSPSDFADDESPAEPLPDETQPRRFFRDPRNQILGGVASGLGTYFGVDPWIPRVIFILLTMAGASGVLIYLILWFLVPKAKTKSDFLQMAGKPVTVDALKDFVASEDLQTRASLAGRQAGRVLEHVAQRLLKLVAVIVGSVLVTVGVVGTMWSIIVGVYALANPDRLFDAGRIFPVGTQETWLLVLAVGVLICLFSLITCAGVSLARQKWTVPVWVTVPLVAVFLLASALTVSFGAGVVPRVQERYDAARHTQTRSLDSFQNLEVSGSDAVVTYEPSSTYSVDVRTVGQVDTHKLAASISDETLHINANDFRQKQGCSWFCIHTEDVNVVVHAPQLSQVTVRNDAVFKSDAPLQQKNITLMTDTSAILRLSHIYAADAHLITGGLNTLQLTGLHTDALASDTIQNSDEGVFTIGRADTFILGDASRRCDLTDPLAFLNTMPEKLVVDGQTFTSAADLRKAQSNDAALGVNCAVIR